MVLIDKASSPLLAASGKELAPRWAELHRQHGVDLRVGVSVAAYGRAGQTIAVLATIPNRVYAYRDAIAAAAEFPPGRPD